MAMVRCTIQMVKVMMEIGVEERNMVKEHIFILMEQSFEATLVLEKNKVLEPLIFQMGQESKQIGRQINFLV